MWGDTPLLPRLARPDVRRRVPGWLADQLEQPAHPPAPDDAVRRMGRASRPDQLRPEAEGGQRGPDRLAVRLVVRADRQPVDARTLRAPPGQHPQAQCPTVEPQAP